MVFPPRVFEMNGSQMEKKPLLSLKKVPVNRPLLASFIASIMSFASGTVVGGWTPPETPKTTGEYLFMMENIEKTSWIVSVYVIGALVGAVPAGQISKSIGRKRFLLWLSIPMTLGWLLIAFFANDVYVIYAGRLLCGLSVGAVTVAVPLYSYDVAPDECRGRGGVFLDLMLCAGILYSYAVSSVAGLPAFSFTCGLVPVAFCALFAFMPESPRHLYTAGRYVDAKSALIWLRGEDYDVKDKFDEFAKRQREDDYESSTDGLPSVINRNVGNRKSTFRKAVVLSAALATIQRMSGAGAVIQYTAKLFQMSGSSLRPMTASIIVGVFQLAGSTVAVFLVDRVGRRKLLLISSAVVAKCLALLTAYFYYFNKGTYATADWAKIMPILIVCAYISFFRIGLGPIPWFMTSELLGADHENRAQSYIASYSWTLSFAVMKSFVPLVNDWPVALWLGYTVLSASGFLFILFFVPETNNRSIETIRSSLTKTSQICCNWK